MPPTDDSPVRTRRQRRPSSPCRQLAFEPLEPRVVLSGSGLTGQYFHNPDFTGFAVERVEAVNHAWGTAPPAPGVDANTFSVRWTGQVEARFTETYTFRTVSDDGVRLWVNGQQLVDNWTVHTAVVDSGTIALEAGKRYDIRLEYFENVDSSQIRLQWTSPSQVLENIPATHLYESPAGLWAEYSDSFGGAGSRIDAAIDFDWGADRPIATVAVDSFRGRWTGLIRPEYSEEYVFSTRSDEGVRVWIGGELIVDHWTPHTAATATGSKSLEAGKWYDIRVEYFEASGPAEAQLSWSSPSQTGANQFEVVPTENLRAAKLAAQTISNPLGPGQDPWVIRWQDSYLHVRSTASSVWIDKADLLQDIHPSDPASTSVRAWTAPGGQAYSTMIWAPELHQINGKWYIYVAAAADNNNSTHRMYVLERDNPNPMGSYVFKGQLAAATDRWAIDGTVLQWQGKLYFIWSGWPGFTDGRQNLYIAEMSNPWTISGDRFLLSTPTYAWETSGLPINEGPQVLVHDGKLHIIYSASGYWTNEYALGRLTYNGTGSITSASSWSKAATPVFQQAGGVVGVGHASFTKSPDGTEDWIVYHAHHDPVVWEDDRDIRIQPFTFSANGTPNFGSPLPNSARIAAPSGTPEASRTVLPGDFDASGAVGAADLGVWTAQFGQETFPGHFVDGNDFLAWQASIGSVAPASAAAAAEPLTPATAPARGGSTGYESLAGVAADAGDRGDELDDRKGRAQGAAAFWSSWGTAASALPLAERMQHAFDLLAKRRAALQELSGRLEVRDAVFDDPSADDFEFGFDLRSAWRQLTGRR